MIRLEYLYILGGLMFGAFAVMQVLERDHPKWWRNAIFWGVYAITFLFGSHLPDVVNGCLVIVMVLIAGFGGLGIAEALELVEVFGRIADPTVRRAMVQLLQTMAKPA